MADGLGMGTARVSLPCQTPLCCRHCSSGFLVLPRGTRTLPRPSAPVGGSAHCRQLGVCRDELQLTASSR